jgi:hypothetical protein
MKPVDPNVELEFRYMVEPKGFTFATSRAHGFHGVYLGDVERLQEIQKKRDATNRDWQRIILRNLAGALDKEQSDRLSGVLELRQFWWKLHHKMQTKEFGNMLLLERMKEQLEHLMHHRRQQFLTMDAFESILNKVHLDNEGKLVEPFQCLKDEEARRERQRQWHESLALDLEEECLIK